MKKLLLTVVLFFTANNLISAQSVKQLLFQGCWDGNLEQVINAIESGDVDSDESDILSLTPLHYASSKGYYEIVQYLIEKETDVNVKSNDDVTPLHLAAQNGHEKIVELLLDKKADIRIKTNAGVTAVVLAELNNHANIVGMLIDHALKNGEEDVIHEEDNNQNNLLHTAVLMQDLELCKVLIRNKIKINAQNKLGNTPLYLAVEKENYKIVKELLDAGADISIQSYNQELVIDRWDSSDVEVGPSLFPQRNVVGIVLNDNWNKPWHIAARKGNIKILEALIAGNEEDAKNEDELLFEAIMSDSISVVKKCIELNIDINAEIKYGKSPLLKAIQSNINAKIVDMLISAGADINVQDDSSRTPLHYAAVFGNADVIKLLITKDAKIDAKDLHEWQPLHFAVKENKFDAVKVLVENDADIKALTEEAYSPLTIAVYNDYSDLVSYLVTKGFNVNSGRNENDNVALALALYTAVAQNNFTSAKILIENGADVTIKMNGKSLLHCAAQNSNPKMIELLMKKGLVLGETDEYEKNEFSYLLDSFIITTQIYPGQIAYSDFRQSVKLLLGAVEKNEELIKKLIENETPLLQLAIIDSNYVFAKHLVDFGTDINSDYVYGLVVPKEKPTIQGNAAANALLGLFSSSTATINFNCPPIYLALLNDPQVLDLLLSKKADLTVTLQGDVNLLHVAVTTNKIEYVKKIFSLTKDLIDESDREGNTPLIYAIKNANIDIVKLLVSLGAEPEDEDILKAVNANSLELVKYLVEEKKLNLNKFVNGFTPLQFATAGGNADIVKYLVEKGAEINAQGKNDCTSMHYAAQNGNMEIIKYLLGKNALHLNAEYPLWDKNEEINRIGSSSHPGDIVTAVNLIGTLFSTSTSKNWKPIHVAAMLGRIDAVKLLLNHQSVNWQTSDGIKPVHAAAMSGSIELIKLLTNFDPSLSIEFSFYDSTGYKNHFGSTEHYNIMLSKVNITDSNGWTPLHWANFFGWDEAIKWLIEQGADVGRKSTSSFKYGDSEYSSGSIPSQVYSSF